MSASAPRHLEVGVRVRTVESPLRTGRIVEDYGDLAGASVPLGTDRTITGRRWAVELDGGGLLFADSAALTLST